MLLKQYKLLSLITITIKEFIILNYNLNRTIESRPNSSSILNKYFFNKMMHYIFIINNPIN